MGNPFVRRSYGYTLPPENLTTGQLSEAQRRDIQRRLNELGYVGRNGRVIGIDRFGESAPAPALYTHFGITADAVVAAVREVIPAG